MLVEYFNTTAVLLIIEAIPIDRTGNIFAFFLTRAQGLRAQFIFLMIR